LSAKTQYTVWDESMYFTTKTAMTSPAAPVWTNKIIQADDTLTITLKHDDYDS